MARCQVVHTFGDILASKHPAITQNPEDFGQQGPVVSMAAQLIQNAPGRGQ